MKISAEKLSTRRKQVIAALCLAQFCADKKIRHPAVIQLIDHLLAILSAEKLADWEQQGTRLELSGRGDPLPASVASILPADVPAETLSSLIETVVQVGLSDMYSASSVQPSEKLQQCFEILKTHGVLPPSLDTEFYRKETKDKFYGTWGRPADTAEYDRVMQTYRRILPNP